MKNRLSRKTREQFEELLEAVYQEGLEDGKASVDKPKFVTEKRVAKVGERILIVDPDIDSAGNKGDIFTVIDVSNISGRVDVEEIRINPYGYAFYEHEYEVIIEPVQVPVIELLTPNEQRAELIEKAKRFVRVEKEVRNTTKGLKSVYISPCDTGFYCDAEYVVNKDKNTVVCLLKTLHGRIVKAKGIAKCMPSDVFNEHIGKAIALARALEIDVPQEFMNAVQPDSPVVGMTLSLANGRNEFKLTQDFPSPLYPTEKIIDDTNAKYGENE